MDKAKDSRKPALEALNGAERHTREDRQTGALEEIAENLSRISLNVELIMVEMTKIVTVMKEDRYRKEET
jgi:hypothetical protein